MLPSGVGKGGESEWFSLKTGWLCSCPSANRSPFFPREDSGPHHGHLSSASCSSSPCFLLLSHSRLDTPRRPQQMLEHWQRSFLTHIQLLSWSSLSVGGDAQRCLSLPDCPGHLRHHRQNTGLKEWVYAAMGHLWRCSLCVSGTQQKERISVFTRSTDRAVPALLWLHSFEFTDLGRETRISSWKFTGGPQLRLCCQHKFIPSEELRTSIQSHIDGVYFMF